MQEWMGIAALFFLFMITVKVFEISRSLNQTNQITTMMAKLLPTIGESVIEVKTEVEMARIMAAKEKEKESEKERRYSGGS